MAEQFEAVTGRKVPRRYRSMITAQAAQLPEVYAAKEQRKYQEEAVEQRGKEFKLAKEAQEVQQEQAKRATVIGAMGTGAMIGAQTGNPWGVVIGAGVGLIGGLMGSEMF